MREIELSDQIFFHAQFRAEDDPPCQLNFYQLFITKEEMLIKTHVDNDLSFIVGWSSESDHALYGPPLPLAPDPQTLLHQLKKCHQIMTSEGVNTKPDEGLYIVLLNDKGTSLFKDIGAQIFSTRDDDNYIYRTADAGNLTGKSLAMRRSRIRTFERKFGILYSKDLNDATVADAEEVIQKWHANKLKSIASDRPLSPDHVRLLNDDFRSALLSLKHSKDLPIEGQVYYLKEEPVGFLSGVPFHDDTFLGLTFKSARIRGLADAMFSNFAKKLSSRYTYLNTGQDLDIPSLRTFKKEWSPCRMLQTYRAYVPANILQCS